MVARKKSPKKTPAAKGQSKSESDFVRELGVLVPKLFEADEAFGRKNGIDPLGTFEELLGKPCRKKEIDDLEKFLGRTLPPSYRAFLSLYGFWDGFCATKLLGPADHRDEHVRATLEMKSDMFDEFEPVNPIEAGAMPLALGDNRPMVLLEPPVRANGEMDVVEYDLTEEIRRSPDLVLFMKASLKQTLGFLAPRKTKKKGAKPKVKIKPKVKTKAKPKLARNMTEEALFALEAGDGPKLLAALERIEDVTNAVRLVGDLASNNRTDRTMGDAILHISEFLFSRPKKEIQTFLPILTIAAVHQRQQKGAAKRERADRVIAKVRPLLATEPFEAELIGAWALGLATHEHAYQESIELFDVALECPTMKEDRGVYCNALWVVQKDNTKLPIDEARDHKFLRACLPHGPKDPAIYHNAACVFAELNDLEKVIAQMQNAKKYDYAAIDLMKKDCARIFPAVKKDPRFKAIS